MNTSMSVTETLQKREQITTQPIIIFIPYYFFLVSMLPLFYNTHIQHTILPPQKCCWKLIGSGVHVLYEDLGKKGLDLVNSELPSPSSSRVGSQWHLPSQLRTHSAGELGPGSNAPAKLALS